MTILADGAPQLTARRALAEVGPFAPAVLAIVLLALAAHGDGAYFPRTWYPAAILSVLVLTATAVARGRLLPDARPARLVLLALAALVGWSFLSIAWTDSPGSGWESANKLLLVLAAAWAFALLPWRRSSLLLALGAWAMAIAVVYAASLIGAVGADDLSGYFIEGRYLDPIGYSNATSALALMAFWPALVLAARESTPVALRPILLAAAAFLVQMAVLPQSRATVPSTVVTLVAVVALTPTRMRLVAPLVLVVAAVALSGPAIYDVYELGTELTEEADEGLVPRTGVFGPVLDDAARAIALTTLGVLLAGIALALVERRARPGPRFARGARVGVVAVLALVAVGGLGVAVVKAGSIADEVSDRWDQFKDPKELDEGSGLRLTADVGDQRSDYYRVAWNAFRSAPLAGIGAGGYEREYSAKRRWPKPSRYAHDLWLRVLAEGGLVGVGLLLGFVGLLFGGLVALWRRSDEATRGLLAGAGAVGCVFFVQASFDWLEEFPALALPAVAFPLAGLTLGGGGARSGRARSGGGRLQLAGAAAGLIAAAAAIVSLALPYLSVRYVERAGDSFRSDPEAAFDDLDRAASLNPLSVTPYLRGGNIAIQLGRYRQAREEFEESLEVEDTWYARLELALLEAERGRFAAAEREIERAEALSREDRFIAEAHASLGDRKAIDPLAFNREIGAVTREGFTRPEN